MVKVDEYCWLQVYKIYQLILVGLNYLFWDNGLIFMYYLNIFIYFVFLVKIILNENFI